MGLWDYLAKKGYINYIKKTVTDFSVFDGLSDMQICSLFSKYTEIINDIEKSYINGGDSTEVEKSVIDSLKDNPAVLAQISIKDDRARGYYFNNIFEAACVSGMGDCVDYIINCPESARLKDSDGNNLPMIALQCERGDIALKGMRTGNYDILCQNVFGDNIGMMAIGMDIAEQDDILEICVQNKDLCVQKDFNGDNLLMKQAYWMSSNPSSRFVNCFKYMLGDAEIRANVNNNGNMVWNALHNLKSFDFAILESYAGLEFTPKLSVKQEERDALINNVMEK